MWLIALPLIVVVAVCSALCAMTRQKPCEFRQLIWEEHYV
jgi:hypothetical protein